MSEPKTPLDTRLLDGEAESAHRSLTDALRVSFGILRVVMFILAVIFVTSGVFNVREGSVAIVTRFGRILGAPGEQVLKPGGPYFAWPAPIDEVSQIPTTVARVELEREFWFEVAERDAMKPIDDLPIKPGGLVPGTDGALVTADHNLVHARWTVLFHVSAATAVDYIEHVGAANRAAELVRAAAERAVVHEVARTTADELIRGQLDRAATRRRIQEHLDQAQSGIKVTEVLLSQPTAPLSVRASFLEVSQAESEKAQRIEAAQREWSRIHNEVAGAGHRALLFALDAYEARRSVGRDVREVEAAIHTLLDGRTAAASLASWLAAEADAATLEALESLSTEDRVSGRVSEIINAARSERTSIVARVRGEAETFTRLLPEYRRNPGLVRRLRSLAALEEILTGDVDTWYLPAGSKSLHLEVNRDPRVERQRDVERYSRQVGAEDTGRTR